MPLFVVRPSRGSWAFFALVVMGALGVRAARRHESRVIQQDRPASETAHALAGCLVGGHAGWALRDADEQDALLRWTFNVGNLLRTEAGRPQDPAWPRRCAELAARLHGTLQRTTSSPLATRVLAQEVRELLERAAASRDERLALIDGDQLASKLAALMMQVRAISPGTKATWEPAMNRAAARAPALAVEQLPRPRPLPAAIEQAVAGEAGTVYGRGFWDGMLHALELDPSGLRDVVVGAAVPLREPPRGGMLRAWRDDGPVMVTSGAVPRMLRMPAGFRVDGAAADFRWDAEVAGDTRALLTLDAGTVRVHAAPVDGPVTWSAPRLVGPGESALAAVIARDDGGLPGRRWRVTVLRPRLTDAALEQQVVEAADGVPDPASTRPVAPVLTVGPAQVVPLPDALPASVGHVETCRAGAVSYIVMAAGDTMTALRLEGRNARVSTARVATPRGARLAVRCDDRRALAAPAPMTLQGGAALFLFPVFGPAHGLPLEVPPGGVNEIHALLLVNDGVLAVVSTPTAVRTWRRETHTALLPGADAWRPAGMVMQLLRTPRVRRAVTGAQAQSRGLVVTLLLEVSEAPRVFPPAQQDQAMSPIEERPATGWSPAGVAALVSTDGGATFSAP